MTLSNMGVDRKWCMRLPPISFLSSKINALVSARRNPSTGRGEKKGPPESLNGLQGEDLNFENWGIDDDYLLCLCRANSDSFGKIKHVNTAHNQISSRGLSELLGKLVHQ